MSGSVSRGPFQPGIIKEVGSFSAVVTTSIYCRPGCGARPNQANTRAFLLAASAEAAGFRACLRCRPYRTHPEVSHQAAPELVCRAVRLVVDGILDDATERELGGRLGISARHLRRLFAAHLGLTPHQLALSTRVHFARRLLDDTDLPIADVAFAAGFGSARQFNRACQDVFRATPGDLRARRRVGDRLIADGGLALRMPFRPPVDWPAMLGCMQARSIAGVEHVSAGSYRRTVVIDGDPGVLELSLGGPDHLVLGAHLPHWAGLIHVIQRARGVFNLDADVNTANRDLAADPLIGPLVRDHPGIRPPGTWDPCESAIEAIAGEQASPADAARIMRRIVERCGTPVPGLRPFGLTHTFPSAPALAVADLRGLGLSESRILAIHDLAKAITDHTVKLSRGNLLHTLVTSTTSISGISAEVAQHLAMRLGERHAFPITGLRLLPALSHATGQAVSPQQARHLADRWQPWRAHAATQLWFSDLRGNSSG